MKKGLRSRLAQYGDEEFALFLRRGFVVEPIASRPGSPNERLRKAGVDDAREHLVLLTRL